MENGKSSTEREFRLWEASEKYLRGEINVDTFEKIELPYEQNSRLTRHSNKNERYTNNLILFFFISICVLVIILSVIAFLSSKNQFLLITPSLSVYLIRLTIKRFYSDKDVTRSEG